MSHGSNIFLDRLSPPKSLSYARLCHDRGGLRESPAPCACVLNAQLKSRILAGSAAAGAGRASHFTFRKKTKWWKQLSSEALVGWIISGRKWADCEATRSDQELVSGEIITPPPPPPPAHTDDCTIHDRHGDQIPPPLWKILYGFNDEGKRKSNTKVRQQHGCSVALFRFLQQLLGSCQLDTFVRVSSLCSLGSGWNAAGSTFSAFQTKSLADDVLREGK